MLRSKQNEKLKYTNTLKWKKYTFIQLKLQQKKKANNEKQWNVELVKNKVCRTRQSNTLFDGHHVPHFLTKALHQIGKRISYGIEQVGKESSISEEQSGSVIRAPRREMKMIQRKNYFIGRKKTPAITAERKVKGLKKDLQKDWLKKQRKKITDNRSLLKPIPPSRPWNAGADSAQKPPKGRNCHELHLWGGNTK